MMLIYYIEKLSFKSVIESMSQLCQLISITLFGAKKKKKKKKIQIIYLLFMLSNLFGAKNKNIQVIYPLFIPTSTHIGILYM